MSGKTETGSTRLKLFERIREAFVNPSPVIGEPDTPVGRGEMVVGVVTDPTVPSLYTHRVEISGRISDMFAEHNALHAAGIVDRSLCDDVKAKAVKMSEGVELLRQLYSLGTISTLSLRRSCVYDIKQGWQVVLEQEYPDENLFPLDHPVNTLFEDIRKAMQVTSESELSFPPPNLPPVDEENGEKSIGVITSPVLKALLHLQDVLRMKDDEESAGLETGIAATCLLCMQERDEQVKRINEIRRAQLLVQELFWAGVVEVIPAALDAEAVNLRRDWTVVSCPIDERIPSFAELLNGLGWDTGRSVQIVRTKQIEL